jgi:hypothetical protein
MAGGLEELLWIQKISAIKYTVWRTSVGARKRSREGKATLPALCLYCHFLIHQVNEVLENGL